MNADQSFPAENPFCTRRIKPGALPFLFPPGVTWDSILKQLQKNAGWGEIIGPHGSGKSTLLAGLIPLLQAEGWHVERFDLHDGHRHLPVDVRKISGIEKPFLLIVDGYEQLGKLSRLHIKRHCCARGWGLIATAHRSVGLPELFNTTATLEQANRVVGELLKNDASVVSGQEIADCYARCQGNLREMLFELYDLFEQRRKS
jgi:hypothetical protein